MSKFNHFIGLLLGGLLVSCATADVLTLDQLKPAEMSFPSGIRQVGIVDNMPGRAKTPSNDLVLGVVKGERVPATEALAGALADSKYFDQVIICDSALQKSGAYDTVNPILSVEDVKSLSDMLGVDMLVSLDGLWVETAKKQMKYPGWSATVPVVQATITPVVRLYLPGRTQPLHTIALTDSLFWDFSSPVNEKIILKEATQMAASKVTNYLVPRWEQVERIYFSGGSVEMRDAAVYIREGEWEEAQNTWKELYNRLRKGKTKVRAAYNIALSYEMLGDIDKAQEWIQKAQKNVAPDSQEEKIIKYYADALAHRISEVVSLKSQMNRFNDNF